MKSTLLLLKMLRWKIALSVAVCFVTLLILSIDMRPSAVDKGFTITGFSLILSFILMGISGI